MPSMKVISMVTTQMKYLDSVKYFEGLHPGSKNREEIAKAKRAALEASYYLFYEGRL